MSRFGRLLGVLLPLTLGCAEEVEVEAPFTWSDREILQTPMVFEDGVLAATEVLSGVVQPGQRADIVVMIPALGVSAVSAWIGAASPVSFTLDEAPGGTVASGSITAPNTVGDHLITVTGNSDSGPVQGYVLLQVSSQSCPYVQDFEGGRCVPLSRGALAGLEYDISFGSSPDRKMVHPRAAVESGELLVACNTDSVAVIDLAPDCTPNSDKCEDDRGPRGRLSANYTEAVFLDSESHCETVTTADPKRVLTSHVGTAGNFGALRLWSVPELPLVSAPILLDSYESEDGFSSIAAHGDQLIAIQKPNRLTWVAVDASGKIEVLSGTALSTATSLTNLEVDGDRLYVTDCGAATIEEKNLTRGPGGTGHLGVTHTKVGGRLHTVSLQAESATLLGSAATVGAPRDLERLPDKVVAVSEGADGIELFDVQDDLPRPILHVDTPGATSGLAYENGYLLASDWDSVRIYDAGERGVLRLLGASDMSVIFTLMPDDGGSQTQRAFGMSWASLSEGRILSADLDLFYGGELRPGLREPRLILHDTRREVNHKPGQDLHSFAVRMSSGSRHPVWVRVVETEQISSPTGTLVIAPGQTDYLEITVTGLDSDTPPTVVELDTNDPGAPKRRVHLVSVSDGYQVGDLAPDFQLPFLARCEGADCSPQVECFDLAKRPPGKPVFLAFFSSW